MLIDGDDVETNGVSIHGDDGNRTESDTAQCMYYMYYYRMQVHVVMSLTLLGDV